jgi:hypothetical protein
MFLAFAVVMLHASAAAHQLALSAATAAAGTATAVLAGAVATAPAEDSGVGFISPSNDLAMKTPAATGLSLDMQPASTYRPGTLTPPAAPVVGKPTPFRRGFEAQPLSAADDRNARRLWIGLSIVQHGAAAFDAWSTRRVISSGAGQELNPILRPFAGNASLYAAMQVTPALLDYMGHRMMYSRHSWARRTWWVPQAVAAGMSVFCGVHNMGVYSAR